MIKIFLRFPPSERDYVMSVIKTKYQLLHQLQEKEGSEKVSFDFFERDNGMIVYIKFGFTERLFKKQILKKFAKDFENHDVIVEKQ